MTTVFFWLFFFALVSIVTCKSFSKKLFSLNKLRLLFLISICSVTVCKHAYYVAFIIVRYFNLIEKGNKPVFFFFPLFLSHCIKKLNEQAAELFESGEDREVNNGLIIMNEFIVPFLPLLLVDEMEEKDILAVEDMRNRWCSYLGQEMECKLKQC